MRNASRARRVRPKTAPRAMPALAGGERVLGAEEAGGEGVVVMFAGVGWVVVIELGAVVAGWMVGLGLWLVAVLEGWALQVVGCAAAFAVTCKLSLLES